MKDERKYFLGLDIGTNSVGWCLTDENYKIVKKGGKSLWGVRMFEEAQDAKARRGFRTARKNKNRRKERIDLLQMLFAEEINKIDPTFFQRLEESFYYQDDRTNKNKYTLFNDGESDYDYFKKFPTIYHLRKELIENKNKTDIRYLYLVISQMLKKRGNFLSQADEFKVMDKEELSFDLAELKNNLSDFLSNMNPDIDSDLFIFDHTQIDFEELRKAFIESRGLLAKKNAIGAVLNSKGNKTIKDYIIPFLAGSELNIKKLFDLDEDIKLGANMEELEAKIEEARSKVGDYDEYFDSLLICKKIYDFFYLGKLLKDNDYLYKAMINKYDEHSNDLKLLKRFVKNYKHNKYFECFRKKSDINNYPKYIGMNKINGTVSRFSKSNKEDFYAYLKKNILVDFIETDESIGLKKLILDKIENGEFLNKLATTDNGIYPYQLNLKELRMILNNQVAHYDFLNKLDDKGISVKDKVESLLTFKIPYYVGPLNANSKNAWLTRTNEKIYPWNFNEVVDVDKSAKDFITRMLNKCTYLSDQFCLPKNSLIFSEYNVLSVLNKININGSPMQKEDKLLIIDTLFKSKRKVTKKDIKDFFKSKYGADVKVTTSTDKELEDVNCNMASYYDFKSIFDEEFVKSNKDAIEQLINEITIFEDKNILEKRIKSEKSLKVFKNKIKQIKSLNYKGYGRISKKLLVDLISYDRNGETHGNILEIMTNTNYNLQEIIYLEKFGLNEQILQYNKEISNTYDDVEKYIEEELYVSPIMKRSLLQAYKIIEEVEKIIGTKIDEYYVECSRTNIADKKRTKSRKTMVLELLESAGKIAKEHSSFATPNEITELIKKCQEQDDSKFQSDKYYLYFIQLGKCMYSLEPIDFFDLNNDSLYDIDHIIPQALFKDDSLSNRVLVKQDLNRKKSNIYPIPREILHKDAFSYYSYIKEKGLISNKKFDNLIKKELSDADVDRFVNRQLVITNQAVKGLVTTLKQFKNVPEENIIYSKAENISDFRNIFDIYKSRTANNFHHAHDAYLNIVVGRPIHKYFSNYIVRTKQDVKYFNERGITTNAMKIFTQDENIRISNFEKYWNMDHLKNIKKNIFTRFDILTTTRTYCGNELLSKATIYPSKKNTDKNYNLFSVKPSNQIVSNVEKYGGFKDESFSNYCLIEVLNKKGIKEYILEAIPRRYVTKENDYISTKYKDFKVIIDKVKINTVIEIDNRKFCITGKSGPHFVIKNMHERHFGEYDISTIKKIDKYIELLKQKREFYEKENELLVSPARTNKNKQIIITNEEIDKLFIKILDIFSRKEYNYSNILNVKNNIDFQTFNTLNIKDKIYTINELLRLLKCNERGSADLIKLGLSKNSGVLLISSKLTPGTKIIYESITGYYRKIAWEYK